MKQKNKATDPPETVQMLHGLKLKLAIVEHGKTETEIAHMLGVSNNTLTSWIKGHFQPKKAQVPQIAAAVGCQVEDIT